MRTFTMTVGKSQKGRELAFAESTSLLSVAWVNPFEECKMLIFQIW
jgi:hypothetical protein